MPTETRQPGQHGLAWPVVCRVRACSTTVETWTRLLGLLGPTDMEEGNSKHMDCRRVEPRFLLHQPHVSVNIRLTTQHASLRHLDSGPAAPSYAARWRRNLQRLNLTRKQHLAQAFPDIQRPKGLALGFTLSLGCSAAS